MAWREKCRARLQRSHKKRAWQPALLTPTLRGTEEGAERRGIFLTSQFSPSFYARRKGRRQARCGVIASTCKCKIRCVKLREARQRGNILEPSSARCTSHKIVGHGPSLQARLGAPLSVQCLVHCPVAAKGSVAAEGMFSDLEILLNGGSARARENWKKNHPNSLTSLFLFLVPY